MGVWTDESIARLCALAADGRTASQIARQLAASPEFGAPSRNAVIGKAARLGVKLGAHADRPPREKPPRVERRAPLRAAPRPAKADARPLWTGAIPTSLRVSLADLAEAGCRFPLGDPLGDDFAYCGSPTLGKFPYCPGHCAMAYSALARVEARQ